VNNSNEYKTKQREIILNYLIENKNRHSTVKDIIKYLEINNQKVGQTTVYRYLDTLINKKQVRKYMLLGNDSSCFQYIENLKNCENHYHFKCENCGELFHFECDIFNDLDKHLKKYHEFTLNNNKFVLYGICKKCQYK
jgi:Fur family ferric uptake transcriptional regulator